MKNDNTHKGMKFTEVGWIPEDWEAVRLEDQFTTFPTASFSRDQMSEHGEVMCVHYGDIHTKYGNIVDAEFDEIPYVLSSQATRYKRLKDGDILLADASEDDEGIGKPISIICHNKQIIAGLHTLPLRKINTEKWDDIFLSYLFSGRMVKGQIERLSEGTKVNSITYNKIKEVLVPSPKNKIEQKRIASVLSDMDLLISTLSSTIEKKRLIKKGTMQQLLSGKTRLKGYTEEWVEKTLGDIGYTYNGIVGKNKNDFGIGDAKYITFLNVLNNPSVDISILEKVNITSEESQNKVLKGDLLFNTSSETPEEVGICSAMLKSLDNVYLNSFCFGYRLNDKEVYPLYLAYYFRSQQGRELMTILAQGATRYNLSKDNFDKSIIRVPKTWEEQYNICSILTTMDDEILALEKELEKYKVLKQGMMQKLLTGQIRLKYKDIAYN